MIRFWEKVDIRRSDECWPWLSWKMYSGYGMFWFCGKARLAHRMAYRLAADVEPDDEVMHSCDNRDCCNPRHLSIGSHAENMAGAAERKRLPAGEESWNAVLTEQDVRRIRKLWVSGKTSTWIANEFGLNRSHVWRVATRKVWQHVN